MINIDEKGKCDNLVQAPKKQDKQAKQDHPDGSKSSMFQNPLDSQTTGSELKFSNQDIKSQYLDFSQICYDSFLVDNLLELLLAEPSFRNITNRVILELLKFLVLKDSGVSYVERRHVDQISKIYYTYLSNIKLVILNNKFIRDTGYELFESEWKNYKNDLSLITDELIRKPFLLIPFNLEDTIEDYPKILRIHKTDSELFRSYLIIFMTLFDFRVGIYKDSDLIKAAFPLRLGGLNLEVNQKYRLKGNYWLFRLRVGVHLLQAQK